MKTFASILFYFLCAFCILAGLLAFALDTDTLNTGIALIVCGLIFMLIAFLCDAHKDITDLQQENARLSTLRNQRPIIRVIV